MKVLMVCLGNICRSPLAHGLLEQKINEMNLDVEVESAGTSGYHVGEKPDSRMIETANSKGCSIDHVRARKFQKSDLDEYDMIFAMDSSNYNNILAFADNDNQKNKVELLLNLSDPGMNYNVPDPYYGGEQGFVDVYNLVDRATDVLIEKLK